MLQETGISITEVEEMGMPMSRWEYKSCVAHFGVSDNWATLYDIESKEKNKGHATYLLEIAKEYYESTGKEFGGTVALNPVMSHIYKKLNIKEYF